MTIDPFIWFIFCIALNGIFYLWMMAIASKRHNDSWVKLTDEMLVILKRLTTIMENSPRIHIEVQGEETIKPH